MESRALTKIVADQVHVHPRSLIVKDFIARLPATKVFKRFNKLILVAEQKPKGYRGVRRDIIYKER